MKLFETGVKRKVGTLHPGTWYSFEFLKEATGYTRSIVNTRGRNRFLDHLSKYADVRHDKTKRSRPVYFIGRKQTETVTTSSKPQIQYKKCVRFIMEEWQSEHQTEVTRKDMNYGDLYSMYYGASIRTYTPVYGIYERIRNLRPYTKPTNVYGRIPTKSYEDFNKLIIQAAFYQVSKDIYEIAKTSNVVEKKQLLKDNKSNMTKTADKQQSEYIESVFAKHGKGKTYMLNENKYKRAVKEIETNYPGYSYRGVLYDIKFSAPFPHRELYNNDIARRRIFEHWKKTILRFIAETSNEEKRKTYETIYELWKIYAAELQKRIASSKLSEAELEAYV